MMETPEREPTEEERAAIETAELEARRQTREELVYQYGSTSYYRDLALAEIRNNSGAGERLERHGRQMDTISKLRETRTLEGTEFEYRVNPNVEAGHGGEYAPPLWLNHLFAEARRPGKILQRLINEEGHEFDLPPGVSSVNLPRMLKGTLANDETPGTGANMQDVETEKVKAQAILYGGISDWAIQDLEMSPPGAHLDWVVFTDLEESLYSELETDMITGNGETVTEPLGLLNVTGINAISYATLAAGTLFEKIGVAIAKVGIERKRPADALLWTTARQAYLATVPTSEQRPLILTDNVGGDWPISSFAGFSVYLDDAIPRTVNGNQEPILAVRSDDFMLWQSRPLQAVIEDATSGTLQVRFRLHRTTAWMPHRFPSGISVLTGAGMKPAPEF
jgi:HK97 family phage major capsid protein